MKGFARRRTTDFSGRRNSTSLACLRHAQGETIKARDLLRPVYGWFSAEFDTTDPMETKTLLDELSKRGDD